MNQLWKGAAKPFYAPAGSRTAYVENQPAKK